MRIAAFGLPVLACLVSCRDRTPARINLPSTIDLYDAAGKPSTAALVNQAGEPVGGALSYSAVPSSILTVSSDGTIKCVSSGDASLIATGAGQSATSTVRCRLVKSIVGPKRVRLIVGRAAEPLELVAEDASGKPLRGVMLDVSSSDASVVRVNGGALEAGRLGTANVTARAGEASLSIPVTVLELIDSSPLALADGESRTIALQQGNYELDVAVKASNGSRYGVTVSWVGTSCPVQPEATSHRVRCSVDGTASLTITNPSAFGLGPSETGFVNLYRAPR